jgi:predicted DCC family thiol-disulfide oxidoreductase YuxK
MENKWTGGQYSVFRTLLGIYLLVHFVYLLPWASEVFSSEGMLADSAKSPLIYLFPNILAVIDDPWFILLFVSSAAIAALFLIVGYKDKIAAIWIWFVLACLFGRNPLIANPSLPYVGWMLLAHLFVPPYPYGSFSAIGRTNPAGTWHMPKEIFLAAWVVLALSYSYSGYTKLLSPSWVAGENINYVLNNPLARDYFLRDLFLWIPPIFLKLLTWTVLYVELFFAVLVLIPKFRMIMWLAMLIIQFGFAFLLNFPDLTAAMVLFHIFTFNPSWVKAKRATGKEVLFYDGNCGLCHRVIRFLLAEDKEGIFKFAPLQSKAFEQMIDKESYQALPDSIVLLTGDGKMLMRSAAVIYLLTHLGGMWRIVGTILYFIPLFIRDAGYDLVGKHRYKMFKKPDDVCPIISEELRSRFVVINA